MLWKTYAVPAPGEPGSETWKDKHNAWQTGGGAFYVTGSYDPATNLTYWGSGNPAPRYDSAYRPGDNLFTNSTIAFDAATGKITWYFQHTANDNHDYDSSGSQIIIDGKVNGEDRKLLIHANRNGFHYTLDRSNGQSVWKQDKLSYRQLTLPLPEGQAIAIGDFEGFVHFLSRESGAFVSRYDTRGGAVRAVPIALPSGLLVQTEDGSLHALVP